MPDTLACMEKELASFEIELQQYKSEFSKVTSEGGKNITPKEEALLQDIERQIEKIRENIYTKVKNNLDIGNIHDRYNSLYIDLSNLLSDKLQDNYLNRKKIVFEAGSCYTQAYQNFQDAINAQKAHLQDIANVQGNIISIIGGGTLSWAFTAKTIAVTIGKLSVKANEHLNNAIEDAVQIGFDKIVSYTAPKIPSEPDPFGGKHPQIFQNTMSSKLINDYLNVCGKINEQKELVSTLIKLLVELKIEKQGNVLTEYKRFVKVNKIIQKTCEEIKPLINQTPKPLDSNLVQRAFERAMWAKWLPSLETITTTTFPSRDEFGVKSQVVGSQEVSTYKTSLAKALKNRLIKLGITDESGAEIDYWTSSADARRLVKWAKNYKIETLF